MLDSMLDEPLSLEMPAPVAAAIEQLAVVVLEAQPPVIDLAAENAAMREVIHNVLVFIAESEGKLKCRLTKLRSCMGPWG